MAQTCAAISDFDFGAMCLLQRRVLAAAPRLITENVIFLLFYVHCECKWSGQPSSAPMPLKTPPNQLPLLGSCAQPWICALVALRRRGRYAKYASPDSVFGRRAASGSFNLYRGVQQFSARAWRFRAAVFECCAERVCVRVRCVRSFRAIRKLHATNTAEPSQ